MAKRADTADHIIKECDRLSQPATPTTINEVAKLQHDAVLYLLSLGPEFDAIRQKVEELQFQYGYPPIWRFATTGQLKDLPIVPGSWSAAGRSEAEARASEYTSRILNELKNLIVIAKAGKNSTAIKKVSEPERVPPAPKRRVPDESADFDKILGKWMHDEHVKLRNRGARPAKGRNAPNMDSETFFKLVKKVEKATHNKKPRFPMKQVLSKKEWSRIGEHNQKFGKKLTWSEAAGHPKFKQMIRRRFNRAEIHYRSHLVPRQS